MPFAIAVVSPPAGAYAWLVLAIGGLSYAFYVPRFVIAFAGATAGTLAALGYVHAPPDAVGLVLLALGALLLNLEFLWPTFGDRRAWGSCGHDGRLVAPARRCAAARGAAAQRRASFAPSSALSRCS